MLCHYNHIQQLQDNINGLLIYTEYKHDITKTELRKIRIKTEKVMETKFDVILMPNSEVRISNPV